MGRKTNSVSLRLKKTNRDYNHCWYGDILYGYHFTESLRIQDLLLQSLKIIDVSYPKMSLIGAYKKANLLVCYLEKCKTLFSENIENLHKPKMLASLTPGYHKKSLISDLNFGDDQRFRAKVLDQSQNPWSCENQGFRLKKKKKSENDFSYLRKYVSTFSTFQSKKQSFKCLNNTCLKKNVYHYKSPLGLTFLNFSGKVSCNTFSKNRFSFFPSTIFLSSYTETINKKSIFNFQNFQNSTDSFYFLTGLCSLEKTCKINKVAVKNSNLNWDHNNFFCKGFQKSIEIMPLKFPQSNFFYIWNLASKSSAFWKNSVCISFIKSRNEKACALFLAHYVSYFLEKKVLFRQIKRQLSSMSLKNTNNSFIFLTGSVLELCKKFKNNQSKIKGLRISCSGRVGGRSKKAQRSRKETFMWGETGLHVFSNKLDFAQTHAETSFGLVGVQVWVCYK